MFATQTEAKLFFVGKVLAQAHAEQMGLSAAEQAMLSWSESDPAFTPDPALVEQLALASRQWVLSPAHQDARLRAPAEGL